MFKLLSPRLWLALLWAILVVVSLVIRPLFPIDETRYVAVAWEMWVSHDFLVPHLNGETYSHKPPLLFWLMQLSWWLFGVNDWSHRFIAPLFSLATLYLSQAVAKELWPSRNQVAELSPFILLGFFFWMVFSTLTMFDIMLSFFALLGMYSLLKLVRHGLSIKRWALLGLAIGGGVLTKGPVILLHILPIALLAPWWLALGQKPFRWQQWYGGLVLAILTGAAIALCWAIPAGIAGGAAYQKAIFLGQTSGRVVDSFAHKLPFWWYMQMFPLLLLPWLLLKPCWIGISRLTLQDVGTRFCLAWAIPVFIAFSLISGKRIHYLLPLMPALALLLARALDQVTEYKWQRAHLWICSILGFIGLVLALLPWLNGHFHWRDDLSSMSSMWGVVLCVGSICLSVLTANNSKESVAYVCVSAIGAALVFAGGFFDISGECYNTMPPAQKIAQLMQENRAVAYYGGKYHGQFNFAGRLTQPITVIANIKELRGFITQYPTAYILVEYKDLKGFPEAALSYYYPFKSHNVGFVSCQALIDNLGLLSVLKPS
jgi:4-amino-4-deoxy-L-arabinose transferase-like glycosyltransferase